MIEKCKNIAKELYFYILMAKEIYLWLFFCLVHYFIVFLRVMHILTMHYVLYSRKKKLTSHWRRFIRPLMWRCKWTELRIKELESQALHYGRELAAHYIRKKNQLELGQFDLKNLGSRSVPFSSQSSRKRAVKRRKRKKVECMADLNSYLSFHNLFSYFGISFPLYLSILVSPLTALPP